MNKTIDQLLDSLHACEDARQWAKEKTWQEIYETCDRGDWLLWLFKRTNPDDLQALTLAKGYCAKTVYHLMKDERSRKAVDAAIAFGEGKLSHEQLNDAADAAYAAYAAYAAHAAADAATYAANAAYAAADAANAANAAYAAYAADAANAADAADAADAAYAANAAYAAYAADAAARIKSQKETADICRKYLPIELWNIQK